MELEFPWDDDEHDEPGADAQGYAEEGYEENEVEHYRPDEER